MEKTLFKKRHVEDTNLKAILSSSSTSRAFLPSFLGLPICSPLPPSTHAPGDMEDSGKVGEASAGNSSLTASRAHIGPLGEWRRTPSVQPIRWTSVDSPRLSSTSDAQARV
ncbi:Os06g0220850 [Oryza sativa Japonica Group]|uniref:Os06g0220850 protein n=2 Tax=Oryza TaxID=4527 RepID=A0A0P0WUP6_ORYSJ|nr:Os06g0220850 [Oryza sativa Japonica Group]